MSKENSEPQSILDLYERHKVDEDTYKGMVENGKVSIGVMWKAFSDIALAAFTHCNDKNHSYDRALTAFEALHAGDIKPVEDAFKKAFKACCGRTIEYDKEKKKHISKFDRDDWDKAKATFGTELCPFAKLEKDGLKKGFRPKNRKGSPANPVTAANIMQAEYTNKLGTLMNDINKADPNNEVVSRLKDKITAVIDELEKEKERVLSAKKLTEAMAPANDEPQDAVASL